MPSSLSFPGCSHPGLSWLPLTGFDFAGLVDWLLLAPRSWEPPHSVLSLRHILAFVRRELESPPLVPCSLAHCGAPWLIAIASLPLVSRPWTGLCWSHLMSLSSVSDRFMVLPRQWVGSGVCSPASTICPPSIVVKQSSFGFSASVSLRVFVMRSTFRVESVSVLDRNEDSSSTLLVFGLSLRNEVTLSGRVCLRSRSDRRLCTHLP